MKENLTEIVCILDASGSMSPLRDDTIGGFNTYIEDQKKQPGEAYLTTVCFDDRYRFIHQHVNLADVAPLTHEDYAPNGMTALMDAVGNTINIVGQRLAATPEEERPSHVVFVITTDGYENASKEFTRSQVKKMIEHQQSKYSWQFIFIGAGIDAYSEAESIGIGGMYAMSAAKSSTGVANTYYSVSNATTMVRSLCTTDGLTDDSWKVGDLGQ